ncbi:MAG: PIG-L family deacetylase [Bacteroidetes bacterium]|nr:PIG-L family deacetylase [Bacteroidota bacterium]
MKNIFILFVLLPFNLFSQPHQMNGAELQSAVENLATLGSVLYIAAHPDDENTALLAYLAKEKHYRVGYLSITRGEGGQNLIGSEQGSELGIIRTQELLDARAIDGAEQYFIRAIDFGFTKTSEEALRFWNKDSVLKDVVWVIRKFQPDVIITRFTPTQGGHGQHLASAILAQEAFKISGDPNVFPEQLQFVQPWKAARILFNQFRFGGINSNEQNLPTIKIDVGAYNPLLGKSYTEIAGISRSMHKSQAMGSPQNVGSSINEFTVTDGLPASKDLFEGITTSWNRVKNSGAIKKLVEKIQSGFHPQQPAKSLRDLLSLYREMEKIKNKPWVSLKMREVKELILSCAALWIEVTANDFYFSPNDSIEGKTTVVNRSTAPIRILSIAYPELCGEADSPKKLEYNLPYQTVKKFIIPEAMSYSQPFWLNMPPQNNLYQIENRQFIGMAENSPPLSAVLKIKIVNETLQFSVPILYKWIDDISGQEYRRVEIVPSVSISLTQKNIVWKDFTTQKVMVYVAALRKNLSGKVSLSVPKGWHVSSPQIISLKKKNDDATLSFEVTPDSSAASGKISAGISFNEQFFSSSVVTIQHSHIPTQTVLEPAEGKLLKINLNTKGSTIGYIAGAKDEVPSALEQIGYTVHFISDQELQTSDFQKYDVIIAGIRSYNTREQLRISLPRLLEYVKQGGTYLVQYQTAIKGETDNIGPYPITLSRDRVTDETAVMNFLDSSQAILNSPNTISSDDFKNWVQERGLYFASQWDKNYSPVFSCADPNEKSSEGSLLYTKYGKGYFVFTGLAFFRQLPAGVEGAYRLFANLLSIGK